jgi:hypothetical protein
VTTTKHKARAAGKKAGESDTVRLLARLGLVARGVMYGTVGVLAANVARGSRGSADRPGAMRAIGGNGLGRVALVVAALGFAGYAVWRLVEATVRPGDRGVMGRFASAGKGLLYAGFAVTTASYAITHHGKDGDAKQRDATARAMDLPLGRWLVALAGIALLGAGIWNVYRAASGRYRKRLKDGKLSRLQRRLVAACAGIGLPARGVAFALVGAFLVRAAVTYDAKKAQGLDGALRTLGRAPYGRPLLVLVAVGLMVFGLWSFVEARYREVLES